MNLSIIIVNYNTWHYIGQTIESVLRSNINLQYEIIIVDNNSHDESCSLIKEKYPEIKLIQNSENVGFSSAVNIGAQASNAKNILLLNPDTIVEENAIQSLHETLIKKKEVGVVGAKIIDSNGVFQLSSRRAFPSFLTSCFQVIGLSYLFPKSKFFSKYNYTYIDENIIHEVDSVSGACIMFSRNLYNKIGGFDEEYFLFFEETDFCVKANKIGRKVIYNPEALVVHYRGESMKTASFNVNNVFYESLLTFYRKNGSRFVSSILFRPIIFLSYRLKNFIFRMKMKSNILIQTILDTIGIVVAYTFSLFLWYPFYYNSYVDLSLYVKHLPILIIYLLSWGFVSLSMQYYRKGNIVNDDIFSLNVITFMFSSSLIYFINTIAFSRGVLIILFILSFLISVLWRYLFSYSKEHNLFSSNSFGDIFSKKIVFIGIDDKTLSIINEINSNKNFNKYIVGYFDFKNASIDLPYLGKTEKISNIVFERGIDEIIISESHIGKYELLRLLPSLSKAAVTLKIIPKLENIFLSEGGIENLKQTSLIKMDLPYYSLIPSISKRAFDIAISILLLFLSLPLHLIYFWRRFNVKIFTSNNMSFSAVHYKSNRSFIKKLPYLWFILLGKISFVGGEIKYKSDIAEESYLKPGIMGLHRLKYFNSKSERKDKCDLYYMKNYSLLLDIEIIFRSMVAYVR